MEDVVHYIRMCRNALWEAIAAYDMKDFTAEQNTAEEKCTAIREDIEAVKKHGSAITVEAVRESVVRSIDGKNIFDVPPRNQMYVAKAPQAFYFGDIFKLYQKAREDGVKTIDSSHLCSIYHKPMHMVQSTKNNLKITEPADFYVYRALYEALEGQQIFGL